MPGLLALQPNLNLNVCPSLQLVEVTPASVRMRKNPAAKKKK